MRVGLERGGRSPPLVLEALGSLIWPWAGPKGAGGYHPRMGEGVRPAPPSLGGGIRPDPPTHTERGVTDQKKAGTGLAACGDVLAAGGRDNALSQQLCLPVPEGPQHRSAVTGGMRSLL